MELKYFILLVHSLIFVNFNQCGNNTRANKIAVIGTAIVHKNQAAVVADNGSRYYLMGESDWDVKYKGRKVKVKGTLVTLGPPATKSPNPLITAPPQPRLRDGKHIEKAKWKLVE